MVQTQRMSGNSCFSVLAALAERSQQLVLELPPKGNAQTLWTGLGFTLLGAQFVVPMGEVAELMRVPPATPLPGVKRFVQGIANTRGRLMAVLDLSAFFGSGSSRSNSLRRVLVVEDEEKYFGFIVDESLGMQHFPQEAFQEDVQVDAMFQRFIKGAYRIGNSEWPVLSLASLAADPDLETLAQLS